MTWEELEQACEACHRCSLGNTRTKTVFGTGSKTAALVFVGEAPGEQEDLSGIPFVGRAGQLFDKYLEAVGIDREEVYIANILKCRPPKNRDPESGEQEECIGFLEEQLKLLRPKLIVCLGRIAAMRLIRPDYKITAEHGQWIEKNGVLLTAVYHPSLLLRDPRKKEAMLADMLDVAAKYRAIRTAGEGENAPASSALSDKPLPLG